MFNRIIQVVYARCAFRLAAAALWIWKRCFLQRMRMWSDSAHHFPYPQLSGSLEYQLAPAGFLKPPGFHQAGNRSGMGMPSPGFQLRFTPAFFPLHNPHWMLPGRRFHSSQRLSSPITRHRLQAERVQPGHCQETHPCRRTRQFRFLPSVPGPVLGNRKSRHHLILGSYLSFGLETSYG